MREWDCSTPFPVPEAPQASNGAPPSLRLNQIIWGSLMTAPVMYCVVSYMIRPGDLTITFPDFSNTLQLALSVAALGATLAGFIVPNFIAAVLRGQLSQSRAPDAMRRSAAEQQVMLVRGALFQSVAIFGLVMVQISGPASLMIPFAVVSFTLLALFFPTRERLARPFEG